MRCEFGEPLNLDRIRSGDHIELAAGDAERKGIAERLRLVSLDRLEANATLERDGDRVRAEGRLRASLEQSCVATGEAVAEHVDEPFAVVFLPEPGAARPDEEVELTEEDCDVAFYDGGSICLGDAIADSLALAMNPYPRAPGAEARLKDAGVISEAEAGPFAALARLKKGGE
jgi:uncharacterized metal-binding protein YceD (DUF177 family)